MLVGEVKIRREKRNRLVTMLTATMTLSFISSDRFNLRTDGDEQKYERRVTKSHVSFNLANAASLSLITSDDSTYGLLERNRDTKGR